MNVNTLLECEDVGVALREGRPLRPARAYRILYAQDNLTFHALELSNPAPLGRQILEAAGGKASGGLQPARHLNPMANLRKYRSTNPLTCVNAGSSASSASIPTDSTN